MARTPRPHDHPRGDPGRADGASSEEFPAINFNFSQYIRDNVEEALSGVKGANSVKIFGSDLEVLEKLGQQIANILRSVRGIENVGVFHIVGQPNLEIEIDREACARYGINVADVETVVQVAIGGEAFSQMVEGEKLFDIVLRLPHDLRDDPGVIARPGRRRPRPRRQARGAHPAVAAGQDRPPQAGRVVHLPREQPPLHPDQVQRPGPRPGLGDRRGPGEGEGPQDGAVLPPGYRLEWSGEFAQMEEANARLMWIIPLSIGLIMVLLYTAFNSVKDALLVMVNVVAATMGGVWAL